MAVPHKTIARAPRVWVRRFWHLEWFEVPYLRCDRLTWAVAPSFGKAHISWNYGKIMRHDMSTWEEFASHNISNWYVKISNGAGQFWYGVIVGTEQELQGARGSFEDRTFKGKERFTAYGLEYLLDRKQITTSAVTAIDGGGAEFLINRAIGFNTGTDEDAALYTSGFKSLLDAAGNQSVIVGERGVRVFKAASGDSGQLWTAHDILKYLLAYHSPSDDLGNINVAFEIDGASQWDALWHTPVIGKVHGRTVWDVMNQIIDRRRISSFYVTLDENTNTAKVSVFTFNSTPIGLPGGATILANPNRTDWDFEFFDRPWYKTAVVHKTESNVFHRVTTRGERRGSVCTISYTDDCLQPGWSEELELDYEAGPAVGSTRSDKQTANRLYRESDAFDRVFRYFTIPPEWDGILASSGALVNPTAESVDSANGGALEHFWWAGLRIQPKLALKESHDYSEFPDVTSDLDEGVVANYRRPFVLAFVGNNKYRYIDKLSTVSDHEHYENLDLDFDCSVTVQEDAPGLIIDVRGGGERAAPQHVIAKRTTDGYGVFDEPTDDDDLAERTPVLDWRDFYATVYIQFDSFCEANYPELDTSVTEDDIEKRLVIDMPGHRLDYMPAGTIVGLDANSERVVTENSGWIQDDRPRLLAAAKVAYQWYSVPRQSLTVTYGGLFVDPFGAWLGTIIENVASEGSNVPVNSAITSITQDFLDVSTTIETQFAELDVRAL